MERISSKFKFYEPKFIKDLDCSKFIKEKLIFLKNNNLIPNLLISGPPGSGKSTAVNVFTEEIFRSESKNFVLKLNASENRGIDIIRNKIKNFCKKRIFSNKYKFKMLILDEADSLTEIAQEALRRTMERFSHTSRFILICNFSSKIIESIQSRCTIFIFKYPNFTEQLKFVLKILENKDKTYNLFKLESIIYFSNGDFRTILKSIISPEQTSEKDLDFKGKNFILHLETIDLPLFFKSCINTNFLFAISILQKVWNRGISEIDIINVLFKIAKNLFIKESCKLKILNLLCEIRLKLTTNCYFGKILFYLINKLKTAF